MFFYSFSILIRSVSVSVEQTDDMKERPNSVLCTHLFPGVPRPETAPTVVDQPYRVVGNHTRLD